MKTASRYRKKKLERIANENINRVKENSFVNSAEAELEKESKKDENEFFSDHLHTNHQLNYKKLNLDDIDHISDVEDEDLKMNPTEEFSNLTHYYKKNKKNSVANQKKIIRAFNKEHYRISKEVMSLSEKVKEFFNFHIKGHIDMPSIREAYKRKYTKLEKNISSCSKKLEVMINCRESLFYKKDMLISRVADENTNYHHNLHLESSTTKDIEDFRSKLSTLKKYSPEWVETMQGLNNLYKKKGDYKLNKTNAKVKREGYDLQINSTSKYTGLIELMMVNISTSITEAVNLTEIGKDLNKSILYLPEVIEEKEKLRNYAVRIIQDLYNCSNIINNMATMEFNENRQISDRYKT